MSVSSRNLRQWPGSVGPVLVGTAVLLFGAQGQAMAANATEQQTRGAHLKVSDPAKRGHYLVVGHPRRPFSLVRFDVRHSPVFGITVNTAKSIAVHSAFASRRQSESSIDVAMLETFATRRAGGRLTHADCTQLVQHILGLPALLSSLKRKPPAPPTKETASQIGHYVAPNEHGPWTATLTSRGSTIQALFQVGRTRSSYEVDSGGPSIALSDHHQQKSGPLSPPAAADLYRAAAYLADPDPHAAAKVLMSTVQHHLDAAGYQQWFGADH